MPSSPGETSCLPVELLLEEEQTIVAIGRLFVEGKQRLRMYDWWNDQLDRSRGGEDEAVVDGTERNGYQTSYDQAAGSAGTKGGTSQPM